MRLDPRETSRTYHSQGRTSQSWLSCDNEPGVTLDSPHPQTSLEGWQSEYVLPYKEAG